MGKLFSGVVGLVALPIIIVILVAVAVGVLTGGTTDLTSADSVHGFTLEELEALPAYAIIFPNAQHLATEARSAHRYTTAGEIAAVAGRTFAVESPAFRIIEYYNDELVRLGWSPVDVPHTLNATFNETTVATWRLDNLFFKLAFLESDELEVEPNHLPFHFQITPIGPPTTDS